MKIIRFDSIDSTNTYLKNNYHNFDDFSVVVANHQSNGYGQFNREFISNKNTGLYCSILIKNNLDKNINLITFYTALCCLYAIKSITNYTIDIKWVNDLYYQQKKLGGILVENIYLNNKIEACIIGIGINILDSNFNDIQNKVTTLESITHTIVNRDTLLEAILNNFNNLKTINKAILLQEYKKYCISLNKKYYLNNKAYFAIDFDDNGNLILKNNYEEIKLNSSYLIKKV